MDNLARDSTMAIASGMSYGKWKALHPNTAGIVLEKPKEKKTNEKKQNYPVRLCRWCGKEIPDSANGHRRYCGEECAYEAKLKMATERYWEKNRKDR